VLEHDQSGRPDQGNPVMKNQNRIRSNHYKNTLSPQSAKVPKEKGEKPVVEGKDMDMAEKGFTVKVTQGKKYIDSYTMPASLAEKVRAAAEVDHDNIILFIEKAVIAYTNLMLKPVSAKNTKTKSQNPAAGTTGAPERKYPDMCEPVLEQQVVGLDAEERRDLAHIYERWALQLFASADLIEQFEGGSRGDEAEIVFPSAAVQEAIGGKPRSYALEFAATLEQLAAQIRRCVGTKNHKPDTSNRLLVLAKN
jgi:hypothetical protein